MKTPRQVLLDRHAGAQSALDALRKSVVTPMRSRQRPWFVSLWQELVLPVRPLLAGLSVVWVFILGLHLSTRALSTVRAGGRLPVAVAREVITQQRILSAMLGLRPSEPIEPPSPRTRLPTSGQKSRRDQEHRLTPTAYQIT